MIRNGLILFLVIIGFRCASNEVNNKADVSLKVNKCSDKSEDGVRICLDSVFNDSRCPTRSVCLWEGDAIAAFTLTKNKNLRRFNLHINERLNNDTLIDGLTITLLNISPYPIADQHINSKNYRAEINVNQD